MKRLAVALALAAASLLPAAAQDGEFDPVFNAIWPVELEPEPSAFQRSHSPSWTGATLVEEDAKLLRIFADVLARQPNVWMLAADYPENKPLVPKFAVALFRAPPSGESYTIAAVDLANGRRQQCELPIDDRLWQRIQEVWNDMLDRTRVLGVDHFTAGISSERLPLVYHFGSDEGDAGVARRPLPGLRPALLAEIGTAARDYCMTKADTDRTKLENLTAKLQARLEKKRSLDVVEQQLADLKSDLNSITADAEAARGKAASREALDKIIRDVERRLQSRARRIDVQPEERN